MPTNNNNNANNLTMNANILPENNDTSNDNNNSKKKKGGNKKKSSTVSNDVRLEIPEKHLPPQNAFGHAWLPLEIHLLSSNNTFVCDTKHSNLQIKCTPVFESGETVMCFCVCA